MRGLLVVAVVVMGCGKSAPEAKPFELATTCRGGELACPRPIFSVKQFAAAQRYYRDKLGFKVDWEYGEPTDFGAVSRGGTQLFVCQGCRPPGNGQLWVATKDVDVLYKELVKRGAIINEAPTDKPWGVREMCIGDPDGNMLRIGSPTR
jgi:catechol 2,3-dioxygenase-like lactoylglutathione lyase family enzyme